FYWPAPSFAAEVVKEMNDGCLVFTYVGHGSPERFDDVRAGEQRFPIMDLKSALQVDTGRRNPVVAIIACSTGEYDRPDRDCIAEVLLARPAGPAAVIASSRISHPFPNALIGLGLARALFAAPPDARLGDIVLAAKSTMLAESKGALGLLARP